MHAQGLSVLFLAVGAGAVFQVAHAIGRQMVWTEGGGRSRSLTTFVGVLAGMLVLYITGVVIK